MPSGRVKFFNTDRAYGFIAPDDGSSDVFVYVHDVEAADMKILVAGQLVDTRSASREMAAQRPSSLACLTPRMPHSRRQLLAKAAIAALRGGISLSFQLDLAFDLVRQADAAERNRARGGNFSLPLSLPSAKAWRTAFSISRCALTPSILRNLRMLPLKMSSFMIASFADP